MTIDNDKTMSNYVMQVDFFGNSVRCESDGLQISANDLVAAGNAWRVANSLPYKSLDSIVRTQSFAEFKLAVSEEKCIPESNLMRIVKGRAGRTMVHLHLAIYIAEQMSPKFHVKVIDTFIEGKLLEFRELGGTEFKNLNACIDMYLPGREDKESNKGIYIQVAKLLRTKLLGADATAESWGDASVAQTHSRYDFERRLCDFLSMGMISDYDHLKETIARL